MEKTAKPKQVKSAGIYPDIPIMDYVLDPAPEPSFNSGTGHAILTQTPMHARLNHPRLNPNYQSDHSSRADLGSIAHAVLLEDDWSKVQEIKADDWRTKEARAQRDEARAIGKIPILTKDMATVRAMVTVAIDAIYSSELVEFWMAAKAEQTLIWQENGVWCRCRPDKLTPDGRVDFDYKTVRSANPHEFSRAVISNGYDVQCPLRLRGIRALIPNSNPVFVFVCQEIEEPYAVSFVSLSPQFLELADSRLQVALGVWKDCLKKKEWPGYPSRVAYVDPPGFYGMNDTAGEV